MLPVRFSQSEREEFEFSLVWQMANDGYGIKDLDQRFNI